MFAKYACDIVLFAGMVQKLPLKTIFIGVYVGNYKHRPFIDIWCQFILNVDVTRLTGNKNKIMVLLRVLLCFRLPIFLIISHYSHGPT